MVTVAGSAPADFVRGGSAVEAVWLGAEEQGLAVHPMSPVFLFAVDPPDLAVLSDRFADQLADGRASFRDAVGLDDGENIALVLRLSHTDVSRPAASVAHSWRSELLPEWPYAGYCPSRAPCRG